MMTEDWEQRIREVPDITNCPRHEVIIQKSHRYAFDHQIRQTGAKLVEVETKEEMIAAINPRTLAIHFTNILSDQRTGQRARNCGDCKRAQSLHLQRRFRRCAAGVATLGISRDRL